MDPLDLAKSVKPIQAYHGSPHDFDQFDTAKVGTGEGAQAYGHGLYFAEHEPVAQGYKQRLAKIDASEADKIGIPPSKWNAFQMFARQTDESLPEVAARDFSNWTGHPMSNDLVDAYRKTLKNRGHMYEVAIDAHPDHFLDWDEPLSEQSEHVKGAFNNVINTYGKISPFSGGKAYQDLERIMGFIGKDAPSEEASKSLHQHGIRGIRYLDERSRGDKPWVLKHPQGGVNEFPNESSAREFHARNPEYSIESPKLTHNYVVFDPKDIEITRRYEKGGVVRRAYKKGGKVEGSIWHGKDADVEYGEPTNSAIVQHVLAKIAAPLPASVPPLGNVTGRRQ